MKFVNPLPFLLDFSLYAITLLRITLAFFTLNSSSFFYLKKTPVRVILIVLSWISGLLLLAGLYTQIAAIGAIIVLISLIVMKRVCVCCGDTTTKTDNDNCACRKTEQTLYTVLIIIAFALTALGAGKLSFDLPL